jgi:hypothetical protein
LKKDTACTESAQNGLFLDMIEGYDATTVLATAQSGIFRLRHYHKMPKKCHTIDLFNYRRFLQIFDKSLSTNTCTWSFSPHKTLPLKFARRNITARTKDNFIRDV